MDDNIIVFATIIVYSTHEQKNIDHIWQILLFQLDYYPFNLPIHGSYLQLSKGLP